MKTLKVYFDDSGKNYQIIKPTAKEFYEKDKKGRTPCNWSELAESLFPDYHSYEVY